MEMSAKQPFCQSNYDAYDICVCGAPHYLHSPPSVPHLTLGDSVPRFFGVFFFLPSHLLPLFYYLSHVLNKLLTHFA